LGAAARQPASRQLRRVSAFCHLVGPHRRPAAILFLHGGAIAGSALIYRHITAPAISRKRASVDSRLAPEHPFPALDVRRPRGAPLAGSATRRCAS
jgi:acetyl esterase/lipase